MNKIKKFFIKAYFDFKSIEFVVINDILAFLTIISIVAIVLETVSSLSSYKDLFNFIEYFTVAVFALEYISRIFVAKKKLSYIFSFFGIIDILAILPTFLFLTNLTYLKSVRVLRIIRFLRMVRLAKLMRVNKGKRKDKDLETYESVYRVNLQIYFMVLFSAIIILGSLVYVIEGGDSIFTNIPAGMLWASKVILGGIPSVVPETIWGEILSVVGRFIGLILFGLLINVVGVFIKKMLFGSEKMNKELK